MDFFAVKVDITSTVITRYDITSVNFNSEKVHEDDIFVRQDILQFTNI